MRFLKKKIERMTNLPFNLRFRANIMSQIGKQSCQNYPHMRGLGLREVLVLPYTILRLFIFLVGRLILMNDSAFQEAKNASSLG